MPTAIQHRCLDRAVLVLRVRRLLRLRRNSDRRAGRRASAANRASPACAIDDPAHLAAPFDVDLLARLDLADVDLDRRAGGFRALGRPERHHERHRGRDGADAADDARSRRSGSAASPCPPYVGCHARHPRHASRSLSQRNAIRSSRGSAAVARLAKPADYTGFARPAGSLGAARCPEFAAGIRRLRHAIAASGRRDGAGADKSRRHSDRLDFRHAPQILAPLRAGLHALPRGAVRRLDAAARPPAPRSPAASGSVIAARRRHRRRRRSRRASRRYADAAKKAMPAVVNIYTSKEVRSRNPLLDDPLFRRYFPGPRERCRRSARRSLGSGVIVSRRRLRAHQPPRVEGADDIQLVLADGRVLKAHGRAARDPGVRPRGAEGRRDDLPAITFGTLEHAAGRRRRARDRQSVRLRQHGHRRASSARSAATTSASTASRTSSRPTRAINPGNSGGALIDTARQPDRHQQHDLLAVRRLDGHRLRDPGVARAQRCSSRSSATAR